MRVVSIREPYATLIKNKILKQEVGILIIVVKYIFTLVKENIL